MRARLAGKGTPKRPITLEAVVSNGFVGFQNMDIRPDGSLSVVVCVRMATGPDAIRAATIANNLDLFRRGLPVPLLSLDIDLLPEDEPE